MIVTAVKRRSPNVLSVGDKLRDSCGIVTVVQVHPTIRVKDSLTRASWEPHDLEVMPESQA